MDLKYPIGEWRSPDIINSELIVRWTEDIKNLPSQLSDLTKNITESELKSTYREGGWTVRQIIHHLADSHMNAYIRHKLAVSTDIPTINPYPEKLWAEMEDVKSVRVQVSIQLLEALHLRWSTFLSSLNEHDYKKSFIHPGLNRTVLLEESIGLYSWHGRHHLGHIKLALKME
ncbi:MAG: YfiT family bacillithiol transferase [Saprospiraceae bacterium]